jgi:surfeit locus 1 family protein
MRFGSMEFSPGRWPTIAAVLVCGLLVSLGFWQLDRAAQKRAVLTAYNTGPSETLLRLDAGIDSVAGLEYRFASAAGHFDASHQFLLDNRTYNGAVGYQVLTPLILKGSSAAVLVNRGWIPLGSSREHLPQIPVGIDPRTVTGRIKVPSLKGFSLGEEEIRRGWPYRIQRVNLDKLANELGYPLLPLVLLLDAHQPDGYVREWHPMQRFGPERNVGYAVQWFGMALTLVIIYLTVNLRKSGES